MSVTYEDLKVLKDYTKLNESIIKQLRLAQTTEEAREFLDMLENLATHENAPFVAKTIYGLAYLMEDKPWYNLKFGFDTVKDAANGDEPFCWFILGSLYLNGKPDLPKDPISAKYWLNKAAKAGYKDAAAIYDFEWGDNPEGFKDYVKSGEMEKDYLRKRFWHCQGREVYASDLGFITLPSVWQCGLRSINWVYGIDFFNLTDSEMNGKGDWARWSR